MPVYLLQETNFGYTTTTLVVTEDAYPRSRFSRPQDPEDMLEKAKRKRKKAKRKLKDEEARYEARLAKSKKAIRRLNKRKEICHADLVAFASELSKIDDIGFDRPDYDSLDHAFHAGRGPRARRLPRLEPLPCLKIEPITGFAFLSAEYSYLDYEAAEEALTEAHRYKRAVGKRIEKLKTMASVLSGVIQMADEADDTLTFLSRRLNEQRQKISTTLQVCEHRPLSDSERCLIGEGVVLAQAIEKLIVTPGFRASGSGHLKPSRQYRSLLESARSDSLS